MVRDTKASLWFLEERDIYKTEKPYELLYVPEANIPRSNVTFEQIHDVPMLDLRDPSRASSLSFDKHGFMIKTLKPLPQNIDWSSNTDVSSKYYPELEAQVAAMFPGAKCIGLSHRVSKPRPSSHRYQHQAVASQAPRRLSRVHWQKLRA